MRTSTRGWIVLALLSTVVACGSAPEGEPATAGGPAGPDAPGDAPFDDVPADPSADELASVDPTADDGTWLESVNGGAGFEAETKAATIGDVANAVGKAIGVIDKLYSGVKFLETLNCTFNQCPATEAQLLAGQVITEIQGTVVNQTVVAHLGDIKAVASEYERIYRFGTPNTGEEEMLMTLAGTTYDRVWTFLQRTNATNEAEVNGAYELAVGFNVLAALVDNLYRTALQRGKVTVAWEDIQKKRNETLSLNHLLVGAQSLWFDCNGIPTQTSTVHSLSNQFPTKKLWRKFASYTFSRGCLNDCNVFRSVTEPSSNICRKTNCSPFAPWNCGACPVQPNDLVYSQEIPSILAKMNRDPVVRAVRAATERLVATPVERGAGMLWRRSDGWLELWQMRSRTSYKSTLVGKPPTSWQLVGTGDFDSDGDGDLLWRDGGSSVSLFRMADGRVVTTTSTTNAPSTNTAVLGDFDGDRVSDVLWTFPYGSVSGYSNLTWWMNSGSTTPRSTLSGSSWTEQAQFSGNFDSDNKADVIWREPGTGVIRVALSTTGSKVQLGNPPNEWVIRGVGDFNKDGYSDVLLHHWPSGHTAVWTTKNGQVLEDRTIGYSDPAQGDLIRGVADLDHDGVSDIIWRNANNVVSYWMMGLPTATIREVTPAMWSDPNTTFAGVVELGPKSPAANAPLLPVTESFCGKTSGMLRNPGFADYETAWTQSFYGNVTTVGGDVTADGKADLVGVASDYVGVIASTGTTFGGYQQWLSAAQMQMVPKGGALGNWDTARGADLVLWDDTHACVFKSTNYGFTPPSLCIPFPRGPRGMVIGDFSGDGRADLASIGDASIRVAVSNGDYYASSSGSWFTGTFDGGRGTFAGDVDGDGKADLVTLGSTNVKVLRANTTGSAFGTVETWFSGALFGEVTTTLGDVDGDGRADLVLSDLNQVRVARSTGTGFGSPEVFWNWGFYGNRGTLLADVDGNARADLVGLGDGYIGLVRTQ